MNLDALNDSKPIDHFSSLPNEILHQILETADLSIHHQVICRRFLPFIRSSCYRNTRLDSPKQIVEFFHLINSDRLLGGVVRVLHISSHSWIYPNEEDERRETMTLARTLRRLFYLLPNLESFTQFEWMVDISALPLLGGAQLSNLRELNIAVPPVDDQILDLNDFQWIAALPSLTTVRLDRWSLCEQCYISDGLSFPRLLELEVNGEGAAESSVGVLVSVCPSLADVSTRTHHGGHVTFEHCLQALPPDLKRLSLSTEQSYSIPVDRLLPRFQQLTHLYIGILTTTTAIHLILLQLSNLVDVYVADETWNAQGMQQVVSGPRRLRKLRELNLDYGDREIGDRFDPEVAEDLEAFRAGTFVAFDFWSTSFAEWLDIRELIRLGEKNGVKMEGSALETLEIIDAFILETYNLAIARTFYLSDSSTLQHAQNLASTHSFPLPRLDYDGTNLEEMSLVKIEREEPEWFTLTLRKHTYWERQRRRFMPAHAIEWEEA